jgi:hypothetical protein
MDVSVPEDVDLLAFDLTVLDSGGDKELLIVVDTGVVGQIDLARHRLLGGSRFEFDISEHAGQEVTLHFYMPADEPNDAEFLISSLEFLTLNKAPVLEPLDDQIIVAGRALNMTAEAHDPDGDGLTFALDAPEGAAIDALTGEFVWTPPSDLPPGDYYVTVIVTDDGPGNLAGWQTFMVSVFAYVSMTATPEVVTRGDTVTLSAAFGPGIDPEVVFLEFHRDTNGNGVWDDEDALLGSDDGTNGWTLSVALDDWPLGEHVLFARVRDNQGTWSNAVSATVTLTNVPPSLTHVTPLAGAVADEPFTVSHDMLLTASDASDPDGEPISFRVEAVTSGVLTMNGEPVTPGETLLSAEETWVWTPADGASGVVEAFTVVAWDGEMASSPAVAVQMLVDRTLDAALVDGTLSIVDLHPDGRPNSMTLRLDGSDLVITDANEGFAFVPAGGELSDNDRTLTIPLALVTSLVIDLAGGDDVLTVDFSGGNPIPVGGLSYDGGVGEDLLSIVGSGTENVVYTPAARRLGMVW